MTAFISPINKDRNEARGLISKDNFIEIYCKASIETCEARDVKGFYKLARSGKIKNYTGIDSPYEVPENPEIEIDTTKLSAAEATEIIIKYLKDNGFLSGYDL